MFYDEAKSLGSVKMEYDLDQTVHVYFNIFFFVHSREIHNMRRVFLFTFVHSILPLV